MMRTTQVRTMLGGSTGTKKAFTPVWAGLERFPAVLNHSVMAGHSPSKTGVDALMPGHPRLSRCGTDVDAWHGPAAGPAEGRTRLAGHDAEENRPWNRCPVQR